MNNSKLPKIASWIIGKIAINGDKYSILGDIEEDYNYNVRNHGKAFAQYVYWKQIIRSCCSFLKYYLTGSFTMLTNYFKIAFRNFKKNKVYSFINILGLAIGLACCIFIFLYISEKLIYDEFHKDADCVYRITMDLKSESAV